MLKSSPMDAAFTKNKHLISRAGFGIELSQIPACQQQTPQQTWQNLATKKAFRPLSLDATALDFDYAKIKNLNAEQKKQLQRSNRQQNIEINLKFLNEMVHSQDQLREKMAFFWHGHFATRVVNPKLSLQILNIIRETALGDFKTLLFAVSKAPAMLSFLNNQQNKKGHPNENFAREVMELFTMGRGNYTEHDVREAARAFTGWAFNGQREFIERLRLHDRGPKTFLGKTGNFDGNDILNIILEQKATARFITAKIYRFFVNDNVDADRVDKLSEQFYTSGYNISQLLDNIVTSSWFYAPVNIGSKIKSPIELMAGMMRMLPMKIGHPESLITYQKLLGQMLLYPPNVAGWPTGQAWIDSSTLLLRMRLPQIWSGIRPLDLTPDNDDDLDMGLNRKQVIAGGFKNPHMSIQWPLIEEMLAKQDIEQVLLQKAMTVRWKQLSRFAGNSIQTKVIDIMSTPEYQLC